MIRSIAAKGEFTTATDISADGVNRFGADLKGKGKSARTIQSYFTAVCGFSRWLATNGKLPSDPLVTVTRFSDVMGNDQPNVMRATGTMDERAGGSAKLSEKRSGRRSELGAVSGVSDAKPCHDDQPTDAPDEPCNPLPFGELSNVVRPDAREKENGTAGIRTQNQRIMSPLL